MAFVLFILGSPRKNGSSERLLNLFQEEMVDRTVISETVRVGDLHISACQGCRFCEVHGVCRIKDDMERIYHLFRESDLIVISTPVFFYNVPSQLKALIDRTQTLWARRYRFGLKDPKAEKRQALFLVVGATKGQKLFSGVELTAKYFLDALGARFLGLHGLREVEKPADIDSFPQFVDELKRRAKDLLEDLTKKKRILFLCRENACRSQMAEALFQHHAKGEFEALSAGESPASFVNPNAVEAMREVGIDIMFRRPKSLERLNSMFPIDFAITMGCEGSCPAFIAKRVFEWKIEDPSGKPLEKFREVRDTIDRKIIELLKIIEKEGVGNG
ncbi:MAG: NAD(P)H-dependent oxidoreductase [Desulfobacterota bacterium]|nr:NAD(P)H-dependent oxidoreductase [Thermodesulfobacteriota bacterium]MDW8001366.1 NAD(P)H-dependent oxidoreductase [Deltaproteobacteria bacterium]